MEQELDIKLRTDKFFIEYLSKATGKSASALASEAGMAPTTLNRFLSKKVKIKSSLKDTTIQKIATKWGFDYVALIAYRKKIEDSIRSGKQLPAIQKKPHKKTGASTGGYEPRSRLFDEPDHDPLMDQIMGATYGAWFNLDDRDDVAFEKLPGLVRLLFSRSQNDKKQPSLSEIKKRAADMLAVAAMHGKSKSK